MSQVIDNYRRTSKMKLLEKHNNSTDKQYNCGNVIKN